VDAISANRKDQKTRRGKQPIANNNEYPEDHYRSLARLILNLRGDSEREPAPERGALTDRLGDFRLRGSAGSAGSGLHNKYAKAIGKRYYGVRFHGRRESLAIERAKTLFGANHCQRPTAFGQQANMAVT